MTITKEYKEGYRAYLDMNNANDAERKLRSVRSTSFPVSDTADFESGVASPENRAAIKAFLEHKKRHPKNEARTALQQRMQSGST